VNNTLNKQTSLPNPIYQKIYTKQFKKDLKKCQKQPDKNLALLDQVIKILQTDIPLSSKYQDHPLYGTWKGCRELHIQGNWLLIYKKENNQLILRATGTHSELFNESQLFHRIYLHRLEEQYKNQFKHIQYSHLFEQIYAKTHLYFHLGDIKGKLQPTYQFNPSHPSAFFVSRNLGLI